MPYLAELGVAADAQAGWRTAMLSGAGSVGAAAGAAFTGLALLDRIGLVATLSFLFFLNGINHIALGLDWKTWYTPYGIAEALFLLSISVFAFWRSLGSRGLIGSDAETA